MKTFPMYVGWWRRFRRYFKEVFTSETLEIGYYIKFTDPSTMGAFPGIFTEHAKNECIRMFRWPRRRLLLPETITVIHKRSCPGATAPVLTLSTMAWTAKTVKMPMPYRSRLKLFAEWYIRTEDRMSAACSKITKIEGVS